MVLAFLMVHIYALSTLVVQSGVNDVGGEDGDVEDMDGADAQEVADLVAYVDDAFDDDVRREVGAMTLDDGDVGYQAAEHWNYCLKDGNNLVVEEVHDDSL